MTYKSYLILLLSLLVSIAVPCLSLGQSMQVENRIKLMTEGLDLNPQQVAELRQILTESEKNRPEEDKQYQEFQQDKMLSEKKMRDEVDAKILSILTPEQQDKFEKMRKAKPVKMDKQLEDLKNQLSLTQEQMASVELIVLSNRKKIEEIKGSNQKNPRQFQKGMKKIMDKQADEIEKILTKEQKKTFKALRKEQAKQMHKNRPRS